MDYGQYCSHNSIVNGTGHPPISTRENRTMKPVHRVLQKSFLVLNSTLILSTAIAQSLWAQDAEDVLEEVVVTGSRIRGVDAPVGSAVISLDRAYIDDSNSVSVDQLIREIPQAYNLGVSESSRGQPGGNGNIVYGNSANLRGIGPFATLVLVDGHRVVTNSRNVDPSMLPTLALERIDVVADGASAVYGSDAIAGVVNLVQRRNVDGGKAIAKYGSGDDYDEYLVGASWGKTWDRGQFFVAVENGGHSNLNGADRDYFRALQPGGDYRTTLCDPGTIVIGSTNYAIPAGGVTPANAASLVPGTRNLCENIVEQDLMPEQEYTGLSFTSNLKITDSTELFLDGFYSVREFERKSGFHSGALTVPNTNAFWVAPVGTNPPRETVNYSFANDLPSDDASGEVSRWGLTAGLKQDLPGEWAFDALVSYGENNEISNTYRGLDAANLNAALASSNPATAFDPFGLHRTSAEVLAAISDQIFLVDSDVDFLGIEALASGPLFELPGGTAQGAIGYEYQDTTSLPGLARGNPGTPSTCAPCMVAGVSELKRNVDSFFAEILVPLYGDGNATSGLKSLDLRAAVRHDDYSDVGSTTNAQFGVTWQPVDDLSFRASFAEAFRAPQFSDLYGNSQAMFVEAFVDPTIGGAPRQGVFQSGGNPGLKPETAETWSFGLDWDLAFLDATRLSVTFYHVDYENQIAQYLGDRNILQRESEFEGTGIILRDAAAAARIVELFAQGLTVARGVLPVPVTLYVDGRPNNLGRSETDGIDFLLSTAWSTEGGSDFVADISGNYTLDYKVAITPDGILLDRANVIFNPLELKARASLTWSLDRYKARAVLNYVGGYENTLPEPDQSVSSFTPVDLNAWISLGEEGGRGLSDGWILGFQVSNVFDEDPPYVNIAPSGNGNGGYDSSAANPIGRLFGVSLEKSF
jgi:iron complex outermembrane receptor protein